MMVVVVVGSEARLTFLLPTYGLLSALNLAY
jgi:hypothetical protein